MKIRQVNKAINISLFILLLVFLLKNIVINVDRSNIQRVNRPSEYLNIHSRYLNEEFLKNPDMRLHKSELYYITQFDSWSASHLLAPIYRAVKTGQHLSNMGYNDKVSMKDCESIDTNMIVYDYKSLYTSSFNNIAEIFYATIPKNLRNMKTKEDELKVSQHMTKFRYGMASFHLLSYLVIFILLLFKYSWVVAWAFGGAVLLSSGIFFQNLSFIGFSASPLLLSIPILIFYPYNKDKIFSYSYIYCLIVFTLLSTFLLWISQPLVAIMLAWAVIIAFTFALDFSSNLYDTQSSFLMKLGFPVIRTSILAVISFIPVFLLYMIEIPQMATWSGVTNEEIINRLVGRVSNTQNKSIFLIYDGKPNGQIDNLSEFWIHLKYFFRYLWNNPIGTPLLSFETSTSWVEKIIPHQLHIIKLKILLIISFVFQVVMAIYFRFNTIYKKYLLSSVIFWMAYTIYLIAFNIVSPRLSSHHHVISYNISFYIMLLCTMPIGFGIHLILKKNIDREFNF